jgi:hypothetical protein
MARYLIYILLIWGCSDSSQSEQNGSGDADSLIEKASQVSIDTAAIQSVLKNADSVILASHFSPNEPIKDERTGKYFPHFEVIEDGKLNEAIVQERKRLTRREVVDLADILCSTATPDTLAAMCFQPRNGIFVYSTNTLHYIDVCFDCYGVAISRSWGSNILFDENKYKRLLSFYKTHGFKYMFD